MPSHPLPVAASLRGDARISTSFAHAHAEPRNARPQAAIFGAASFGSRSRRPPARRPRPLRHVHRRRRLKDPLHTRRQAAPQHLAEQSRPPKNLRPTRAFAALSAALNGAVPTVGLCAARQSRRPAPRYVILLARRGTLRRHASSLPPPLPLASSAASISPQLSPTGPTSLIPVPTYAEIDDVERKSVLR